MFGGMFQRTGPSQVDFRWNSQWHFPEGCSRWLLTGERVVRDILQLRDLYAVSTDFTGVRSEGGGESGSEMEREGERARTRAPTRSSAQAAHATKSFDY